jgi:hypothetical protein
VYTSGLADGAYTFRVRALDAAGNVDATPASASFTVDTTAPDTLITSSTTGAASSFSFSATESPATYACRLDGPADAIGAFQACASPKTYTALADGTYTFRVRATDAAGNVDATPATQTWTVAGGGGSPGTVPPTPALTAPTSYSYVNTSAVTLSGTAQPGVTVEILDDSTVVGTTTATLTGTWSRTVTGVADGAHMFSVRARNAAGASPSSAARVILVDTTAPKAPVITAPAEGAIVAGSFTVSGTAESGATVELFESGVSRGTIAASGGTWTRQITGVSYGSSPRYTARAIDLAGNVSPLCEARTVRSTGP